MPSETDLLNDALSQIGEVSIGSISDGTTNADYCQALYPALLDSILRSHHWNFALTRVALSADVDTPVYEFAYQYTLPADCLKVVAYAGGDTSTVTMWYSEGYRAHPLPFKIEGRKLYSNDGVVYIQYLARKTNPAEWDALFYQVVATWLASKLAMAITKDAKKSNALLQQAVTVLLPMALAVDGQEGSIEPFHTDDLLWGRSLA